MITKEEIKKLADLARIEIGEVEMEKLTQDVDAILGYIGQIKDVSGVSEVKKPLLRNVMREDVVTHNDGEYTEKLLQNAPQREGNYLKVKKILG